MSANSLKILTAAFAALLIGSVAYAQDAGPGYLKTKVSPGRAGVFVDGKYVGPAKNFGVTRKYSLPAGEHEITLSEPRYRDFKTSVKVDGGRTLVISRDLEPLPMAKAPFGQLRTVSQNKYDAVYVNGKYMGHVDEFDGPGERLLLKPGQYTVRIAPVSGGRAHEETIVIAKDRLTVVNATAR